MKRVFALLALMLLLVVAFSQFTEAEVIEVARDDAATAFQRKDFELWENWTAESWFRIVADPNYDFYGTIRSVDLQQAYRYAFYLELNSLYFKYLDESPDFLDRAFHKPSTKATLDLMPRTREEIPLFVSMIQKEEQVAAMIRQIAREKPSNVTAAYLDLMMSIPLNKYLIWLFPQSWRDDLRSEIAGAAQARRRTTIIALVGTAALLVVGLSVLAVLAIK